MGMVICLQFLKILRILADIDYNQEISGIRCARFCTGQRQGLTCKRNCIIIADSVMKEHQ